ncbi:MAG TPA: hypothetical protein VEF34_19055, partial [Syntrophobacteraceae bacterium]|nr:hypothetical protein [Syntrophobacteraceae bacterium]
CSMPSVTPGVGALARLAKVWSLCRACNAWPFLPFQASISIEQPISQTSSLAASAPVACILSGCS